MQIYDVSMIIQDSMLVWRGDPPASIKVETTVEKDGVRFSSLSLTTHTGTHVDAPSHFIEGGEGIDQIPIEKLIGPCKVIDLTSLKRKEILPEDFKIPIQKRDRILLRTGNFILLHQSTFPNEYVSLSLEAAEFLASKEIYLVGTDFLGIEKQGNPGHPVHKTLLRAGIVNLEGLDLSNVPEGSYELICLPLKISKGDGAPARVILIKR